MKRSEMINCLLRRYESCLDSSVGDTFEGIVDALLNEVEVQGMLPPYVVARLPENSPCCVSHLTAISTSMGTFIRGYVWEPENE